MKFLLISLLLFLASPIKEIENTKLALPINASHIVINYSNENFSQRIIPKSSPIRINTSNTSNTPNTLNTKDSSNDSITIEINNSNYLEMNLNFRIIPNRKFLTSLPSGTKNVIENVIENCDSLRTYMINVSEFLEKKIQYTEDNLPQDTASVLLNRKANCIGYSNLMKFFLDAAGIRNSLAKGFYLKKDPNSDFTLIPIPHRWIEIHLAGDKRFFYDPQFQRFSSNYIATRNDIDFKQIKKFTVRLLGKSKSILN